MHALVEDHAADELHVVVAHPERAPAGLAADGEGLDEDVVERRAVVELLLELGGLGLELGVGELRACSASSALIASTFGRMRRIARSCEVPKTFLIAQVSMRILAGSRLGPRASKAGRPRDGAPESREASPPLRRVPAVRLRRPRRLCRQAGPRAALAPGPGCAPGPKLAEVGCLSC